MAANYPKIIFFIGAVMTANSCAQPASTSQSNEPHVLPYLTNQVSADLVYLETSINNCDEKAKSRGAILLEDFTFEENDTDKEKVMVGISHLYFSNLFECERSARQRLAFSLGTLNSLNPRSEQVPPDIEAINAGLLYPTRRQIEYAVHYQSLPEGLRVILEDRIGKEPFELMSTLEQNGLIDN